MRSLLKKTNLRIDSDYYINFKFNSPHLMKHQLIIRSLENNIAVFNSLLSGSDVEFYTWRFKAEKWNLLEIVCHLYDEEREDFRARLQHVLEKPEEPLPPIDPTGWVLGREYSKQDYLDKLDAFLDERENSISWLRSLKNPSWDNAYHHPKFGPLSGNMFLANWLEHDYLHMRQILNLKHEYLKHISGEKLNYAGDW